MISAVYPAPLSLGFSSGRVLIFPANELGDPTCWISVLGWDMGSPDIRWPLIMAGYQVEWGCFATNEVQ